MSHETKRKPRIIPVDNGTGYCIDKRGEPTKEEQAFALLEEIIDQGAVTPKQEARGRELLVDLVKMGAHRWRRLGR